MEFLWGLIVIKAVFSNAEATKILGAGVWAFVLFVAATSVFPLVVIFRKPSTIAIALAIAALAVNAITGLFGGSIIVATIDLAALAGMIAYLVQTQKATGKTSPTG